MIWEETNLLCIELRNVECTSFAIQHSLWSFAIKDKTKQRSCVWFNCQGVDSGVGGLQGWCLWGMTAAAQCWTQTTTAGFKKGAASLTGSLSQAGGSVWKYRQIPAHQCEEWRKKKWLRKNSEDTKVRWNRWGRASDTGAGTHTAASGVPRVGPGGYFLRCCCLWKAPAEAGGRCKKKGSTERKCYKLATVFFSHPPVLLGRRKIEKLRTKKSGAEPLKKYGVRGRC